MRAKIVAFAFANEPSFSLPEVNSIRDSSNELECEKNRSALREKGRSLCTLWDC